MALYPSPETMSNKMTKVVASNVTSRDDGGMEVKVVVQPIKGKTTKYF